MFNVFSCVFSFPQSKIQYNVMKRKVVDSEGLYYKMLVDAVDLKDGECDNCLNKNQLEVFFFFFYVCVFRKIDCAHSR